MLVRHHDGEMFLADRRYMQPFNSALVSGTRLSSCYSYITRYLQPLTSALVSGTRLTSILRRSALAWKVTCDLLPQRQPQVHDLSHVFDGLQGTWDLLTQLWSQVRN